MTREEIKLAAQAYSNIFDAWATELQENEETGTLAKTMQEAYAEIVGAPKHAPIALMFSAFVGGFNKAISMLEEGKADIEELKDFWGRK